MIPYTVRAYFQDRAVADEWIAWLRDGHLADVIAGGALDAEVLRMDADGAAGPEVRCEARYHFPSQEVFDAYVCHHAPRLRAEGLSRFPPERGVRYERTIGEVEVRLGF